MEILQRNPCRCDLFCAGRELHCDVFYTGRELSVSQFDPPFYGLFLERTEADDIFVHLYLQVTRSNPSVVSPELFTIGENMY